MFPISDVIPSRTVPVVTIGLISLNALAFLYELQLDDSQLQLLVHYYGVVPATFSSADIPVQHVPPRRMAPLPRQHAVSVDLRR